MITLYDYGNFGGPPDGLALACQTRPKTDVVVAIAACDVRRVRRGNGVSLTWLNSAVTVQ
jgi:hypothetical protein